MVVKEKTTKVNDIFHGRIIYVHHDEAELENGAKVLREVCEHPGGVCVGALTKEEELLFVRQWRYPIEKPLLELPAGKLEPGEAADPLSAVMRELKEETGYEGYDFRFLGNSYASPGFSTENIRLFCCKVGAEGLACPDEDEFLEVERIPLKKAVEMVFDHTIEDGKTQNIIMQVAYLREHGEI